MIFIILLDNQNNYKGRLNWLLKRNYFDDHQNYFQIYLNFLILPLNHSFSAGRFFFTKYISRKRI